MQAQHSEGGRGLSRRRLGTVHVFFFTVAASAPLTVLGGGVTTTFAITNIPAVAVAFLILMGALGVFAVGYAAMSRYVSNAGAFYSYLANGLGRAWGVAGSFVALVSYNAIQIGLYGLFGAGMADFFATRFGVDLLWWIWALIGLVAVGVLGLLRIDLNARVLAVLLILEILAVVVYDIGALANPAGGTVTTDGLDPVQLFVPGVGAVFALCIAAFIGFESAAIYSEECRNPRRTVARATYLAVAFTGVFYAFSAWAMTVNVGPEQVGPAAVDAGPGLLFGALAEHWGTLVADLANVLFLTSVFAALMSFHNGVARYLFALGRERVLPAALGTVGARNNAPVAGSLTQSAIAAVVVILFVLAGRDPVLDLFTWFSGVAAVGVILLMTGTSAAVIGYFRRRRRAEENTWSTTIAPATATVVLGAVLLLLLANFGTLLGPEPDPLLRWSLPGLVLTAAAAGLIWGAVLRTSRPDVYAGIGRDAIEQPAEEDITNPVPHGGQIRA